MKHLIAAALVLGSFALNAQVLDGQIKNAEGAYIQDAIIYSTSLKNHTHSDSKGSFQLENIKAGDTIRIQYLGYQNIERAITSDDFENTIQVTLTESEYMLDQVYIDNSLKSLNTINNIDLRKDPVNSSQEVLQKVPGLFIAQHAGGGKAEQIFLRGFDIDHGTDIALSVDGMPVNMVSHAHGQGYSDLHFVIPETIDQIDFGKGPYYADKGNFTTAGYVDFKTKDVIDESTVAIEAGRFNSFRSLAMLDLVSTDKTDFYLAGEFLMTDGPFESNQNFRRSNGLAKYKLSLNDLDNITVEASRFYSQWDASGQIPQRLVDDGTISRFGAVDNTEGGNTSRTNLSLTYNKSTGKNSFNKLHVFYSYYDFELYSNFTFFLEDPVNGDQIRQKEKRNIYGLSNTWFSSFQLDDMELEFSAGAGFRHDDIDGNELSKTRNRTETLERVRLGDVNETNTFAFADAVFILGNLSINPSLRVDHFNFHYIDRLSQTYDSRSQNRTMVSPKLNFLFNPGLNLQVYLKSGIGFHSNDTRLVIQEEAEEILPAAYGTDLGVIWKPVPEMWLNMAIWYLELEQEFVYVGDAGIVEASGRSRRRGFDFGVRYQLGKEWYVNGDLNYTIARSIDEPEGSDYIPLAPDLTAIGGIYYTPGPRFSAGIKGRYLKDRPANEDNSITAEGYFVTDLNLNYNITKDLRFGIFVENLLNVEWNEAQFATLSRLKDEVEPVEEIHFTPGVPFYLRGQLKYNF